MMCPAHPAFPGGCRPLAGRAAVPRGSHRHGPAPSTARQRGGACRCPRGVPLGSVLPGLASVPKCHRLRAPSTTLLPRVTKCHRTAPGDASPSPRAPRSGRGRRCCLGARGQQRMLCEQPGSSSSSIPGMKLKLIPDAAWAQSLASSSSLHFVLRAGAGSGRVGGRAPLTGAVRVLVPWQHPHSVMGVAPGGFGAPSPGTIPRRGMRSG